MTLQLVQNPDILQTVAMSKARPLTVGFAAETEAVVENARKKLQKKKLDMIIANNVADTEIGFNSDDNETIVITKQREESLPKMSKTVISRRLITMIADALETS